ncbi:UNKNOWN [Stylonychia lemnae]|uniref:Uncharacterized protein n=1 Tax=Stylonychia lemnae TaxID=5949 RepID=A0A078AA17_STYLE|nr:UNKNOWN [Stylonychia lemnae]|eukprot:CDW78392.1 UNKNOWN [Stylonychia lemnae]
MTEQFKANLNAHQVLQKDQHNVNVPHIITSANNQLLKRVQAQSKETINGKRSLQTERITPNIKSKQQPQSELRNINPLGGQIYFEGQVDTFQPIKFENHKLSRDSSPVIGIRNMQTLEISNNKNQKQQQLTHRTAMPSETMNKNFDFPVQSKNYVNQNQNTTPTYMTSKQTEHAAMIGAQIILNQYLKIQSQNNNQESTKHSNKDTSANQIQFKKSKRDKLMPRKQIIEKAKDQIVSQVMRNQENVSQDSSMNSQFLPTIQQAKIITNQKIYTHSSNNNNVSQVQQSTVLLGGLNGISSIKHDKKKSSYMGNEYDNTSATKPTSTKNTHKNLISFIEEQKKFANEFTKIQTQPDQYVNNNISHNVMYSPQPNQEIRHAKSFINKLDIRDRETIDQKKNGSFFQFKSNEKLDQVARFNNKYRIVEGLHRSLIQKTQTTVNTVTLQLPQIKPLPQINNLNRNEIETDQTVPSARQSVISDNQEALYSQQNQQTLVEQPYFNINYRQQQSFYIQDCQLSPHQIFPEQSQSNKALRTGEIIMPFSGRKMFSHVLDKELKQQSQQSQNPPSQGDDCTSSQYGGNPVSQNNTYIDIRRLDISNHAVSANKIRDPKSKSFTLKKLQLQQQKITPRIDESVLMRMTSNQQLRNETVAREDQLKNTKIKQIHERRNQQKLVLNKASINFEDKKDQDEIPLRDKNNNTKQSSISYISGFLKQKLQFKSPRVDTRNDTGNQFESIMIQSMALSTQQSCTNILQKHSHSCLANKESELKLRTRNATLLNMNTTELTQTEVTENWRNKQDEPGRVSMDAIKFHKTPMGTYKIDFDSKQQRLKMLLNQKGSSMSSSFARECKDRIKQMFQQTKKLPAMTLLKHGQSHRLQFSRRQNMEYRPLVILIFSDLVGVLESQWDQQEKKKINHKLYLKRQFLSFLKDLLEQYQVALYIDVRGKDKYQYIKEILLQKEEYYFDGLYTFNHEETQQNSRIDIDQILIDFGVLDNNGKSRQKSVVKCIQGIKYEEFQQPPPEEEIEAEEENIQVVKSPDYELIDSLRQAQYQIESGDVKVLNIIVGQSQFNLESVLKVIREDNYQVNKYVKRHDFNINMLSNAVDLAGYYGQLNPVLDFQEQQACLKFEQYQPDIKIAGLLAGLRDKNAYIKNEKAKYFNQYRTKYRIAHEINNNNMINAMLESSMMSSHDQSQYHTIDNNANNNNLNSSGSQIQMSPDFLNMPYFQVKSFDNSPKKIYKQTVIEEEDDFYDNDNSQYMNAEILNFKDSTIVIGTRNNFVIDDYVLIDQRVVKSACRNVLQWLCKK